MSHICPSVLAASLVRYVTLVCKGLRFSFRRSMVARRTPGLITVKAHGNALCKQSPRRAFFHRSNPRIAPDISCALSTEHTPGEPETSALGIEDIAMNTRHLALLANILCRRKREKDENKYQPWIILTRAGSDQFLMTKHHSFISSFFGTTLRIFYNKFL